MSFIAPISEKERLEKEGLVKPEAQVTEEVVEAPAEAPAEATATTN